MSRSPLTDAEVAEIARDFVELELLQGEAPERPRALILAGQSGAGKSTIAATLVEGLERNGGYIAIDADQMRNLLPYYDELDHSDPNLSRDTQKDAGRLAMAVRDLAVAARRNVIVDGTLRDPDAAQKLAQTFRGAGYQVELHALAVNDQISYLRAATRYERDAAAGVTGRMVPREWHDDSFKGVAASVRRLEYTASIDRVAVYNRVGDHIHDAVPVPGTATAGDKLERARAQLTSFERVNIAEHWDAIFESMEKRRAPASLVQNLTGQLERAHYTLRASPEASESYDHDHPAERHGSQSLAASYGQQLDQAFRAGQTVVLAGYPELAPAFEATARAIREAELQPLSDRPALVSNARAQILKCLVDGAPVKYELKSPIELEFNRLKNAVTKVTDSFELVQSAGMALEPSDHQELSDAQRNLSEFVAKHAGQLQRVGRAESPRDHVSPREAPSPRVGLNH